MSRQQTVEFENEAGLKLAGRLHLPLGRFRGAALFAHCFTCSKDITAAKQIADGLSRVGIAVLRFDFTGLAQSEGDFAATGFHTNISDLIAAASFLSGQSFGAHNLAPQLLIGHSLGGAAVLAAAPQIASVKGVATIGAPAEPGHVLHLLADDIDTILAEGSGLVHIGGRPFAIGAGFVRDLQNRLSVDHITRLSHDLLILHAPLDTIVGIENAAAIFTAARHPKSFISLDRADHLLSAAEDRQFAADMISAWARRCLGEVAAAPRSSEGEVDVVTSSDGDFAQDILAGQHQLRADEPEAVRGGLNTGPSPYDFLLAGLGACTAMTLKMYARRKGWPLADVRVRLSHAKTHQQDCLADGCLDQMDRRIELTGPLDEAQQAQLLQIADKCPVHKTLQAGVRIHTSAS